MKKYLCLSIFFFGTQLILTNQSSAQWIQTSGVENSIINCFTINKENLLTGNYAGIYLYNPDNSNWSLLPNSGLTETSVFSITANDNYLFAGTYDGVFRSSDDGNSWLQINSGLLDRWGETPQVTNIVVSETTIVVGTVSSGAYFSTNNGNSWNTSDLTSGTVTCFTLSGTEIFMGRVNKLFHSTDNGKKWNAIDFSPITIINSLAINGMSIFVGTDDGLFFSTNNGANWNQVGSILMNKRIISLYIEGTTIFAGSDSSRVFLSTNNGTDWRLFNTGLMLYGIGVINANVYALSIYGSNIFAGLGGGGVWKRSLLDITSVNSYLNNIPTGFELSQNFPNPFNPVTTISFCLPSDYFVSLKVFDIGGGEVATLINEELTAGIHIKQWNAENIPSGIYFYRLQANRFTETKKLILLH